VMGQLTVLFCGATGRLAALTPILLDRGHRVLAATREPGSARAQRLRERGAQIVRMDFDEVASLTAAARQADTVVAAGTAHAAGPVNDLRHGRNVVDAARAAGVGQLIYLTVAGADRPTGVPIMDSKHALERDLRDSGVPHTIISPVYFMENLWNPWNAPVLATGRLPSPVSRFKPLQQIPIQDVLAFTAHALESRDAMLGERIEMPRMRSLRSSPQKSSRAFSAAGSPSPTPLPPPRTHSSHGWNGTAPTSTSPRCIGIIPS
jgi:uncharacterized protein YbjT (DUF2867 family)